MTTIAMFGGWLASDGRLTNENEILDDRCSKIVSDRPDGLIITGSGDGGALEMFTRSNVWDSIEWLPGGGPNMNSKLLKLFKNCDIWVYRPGDEHMFESSEDGFNPLPLKGFPQSLGTGASYFKGAMHALIANNEHSGYTSRQMVSKAMDASIKCDMFSGGKVTIMRLK